MTTTPHSKTPQLWASLYFPHLQLDAINPKQSTPIAITERVNNRLQIVSCTAGAADYGVYSGMALNSAYALCPALTTVEYDSDHQQRLLQNLGEWSMQFSSIVCLHAPSHVLIEIAGSQRLFEGLDGVVQFIHNELQKLAFDANIGIAPTQLAANLLASSDYPLHLDTTEALLESIKTLPVSVLDIEPQVIQGLQRSGISAIGNLLTVSPASLTRRFGPGFVKYLDCLIGKHPYPVKPLRSSEFFTRALDLPVEVDDTNALQFATQRMICELSAFLIARDCGVNYFEFILRHERHPDTLLTLRFVNATSQSKHLHQVLTGRLSSVQLPAPVCGLTMVANEFSLIERNASDFFQKSQRQQQSIGEVIDRLGSRLGNDNLYTLTTVDDHRPEKAWQKSFPGHIDFIKDHFPVRPVWILDNPIICKQALEPITAVERIETGWWDEVDVRRDYFIACDKRGKRYWVYKERDSTDTLYIHGIFA